MRPSRTSHLPRASALAGPLATALPLLLLFSALLPGGGLGASPLQAGTPDGPWSAGAQQAHAGAGAPSVSSDGAAVVVSVSPPTWTVVSGQTLSLAASVSLSDGSSDLTVTDYAWSLSSSAAGALEGNDGSSATFYAAAVSSVTAVTITVQASGFYPAVFPTAWFTNYGTAQVSVVPPLSVEGPSVSPDPASPGEEVSVFATISGGLPPYTLEMSFGDGTSAVSSATTAGIASFDHSYRQGSYYPSVQVQSSDGESASASSGEAVMVTTELGASIALPSVADEGTLVTLEASVGGGTPPYSYHWSDSSGDTSYSGPSWSLVPSHPGPLLISLEVTDSAGQNAWAPAATLVIERPPSVTLFSATPQADVGTPFPLMINVSGGSGPFDVVYSPGGDASSLSLQLPSDGSFAEPYVFDEPGEIWSSAEVTDAAGAVSSCSRETGEIVTPPTATLSATPSTPVAGSSFQLTADVLGGLAPYRWSWMFSGPVSSSTPLQGVLSQPGQVSWNGSLPQPESLTAQLQIADASGGLQTFSLALQVEAPLTAGLQMPAGRGEVGQPLQIVASVGGGQGPYQILLFASDGESALAEPGTSGPVMFTLVPRTSGNLTVQLQVQDSLGRTYLASAVVGIAPAFQLQLALTAGSVDVGATPSVILDFQGGWGPYSGTLALARGGSFTFQTTSNQVTFPVGTSIPGALSLTARATDALGIPSQTVGSLQINPLPRVALTSGTIQTDVGVPVPFLVGASSGTGTFTRAFVDFGDGNSSSSFSPVHAYTGSGTYLANATVWDSSGGSGSSTPLEVHVSAAPQADADLTTIGADQDLGASFSSQVEFGTAPYSYAWDFGDGSQSAEADPTHVYGAPGTYRTVLRITDAAGVSTEAPPVNVSVAPPAALSIFANRSDLEVGIASSFDAQVLGGAPPVSVVWTFGDGSSQVGPSLNHSYVASGTYQVVAHLSDAAGGTASAVLTVVVYPALASSPIQLGTPGAEVGVSTTLSEVPAGGVSPYRFAWQVGGLQVSGTGMESLSITPSVPGLLQGSVQITDAEGASSTQYLSIPVAAALQVNLTSSPFTPEAGLPFRVTAAPGGGVGSLSFLWTLPPGIPVPGNRTSFEALVSSPGSYPLSVTVTDGLGRTVTTSLLLPVVPPLSVGLSPGRFEADAGVPTTLSASAVGGVGNVLVSIETPFGKISSATGSLTFPLPGTYPVEIVATDQDGAIASGWANLTVSPLLSATLQNPPSEVAAGVPIPWRADVEGGSSPTQAVWSVAGIGSWEGPDANITFPEPGTYEVVLDLEDSAGARLTLTSNVLAVADPLSLTLNISAVVGVAPFDPVLSVVVQGGSSPVMLSLSEDGGPVISSVSEPSGMAWVLSLPVPLGTHTVAVSASDALGGRAASELVLTSLGGIPGPSVVPVSSMGIAGVPVVLQATEAPENGSVYPGSDVAVRFFGNGLVAEGPGEATFLWDQAGTQTVRVSATLALPGVGLIENVTVPVTVQVLPGPASSLEVLSSPSVDWAGENATVELGVTDAFGNLVSNYTGLASCQEVEGPSPGGSSWSAPLNLGVAQLQGIETKAGNTSYRVVSTLPGVAGFRIDWLANPYRAVLRLTSFERLGSGLLLNISGSDVFGNPLSGVPVLAGVPGGTNFAGTLENGSLSIFIPGAGAASTVEILGPAGAETTVALDPDPPTPQGIASLLLVAAFLGGALAVGIVLGLRHRRRRAKVAREAQGSEAAPLAEAMGTLEEIMSHLPGEERETLVTLACEHGVPRDQAEEGLSALRREGRATVRAEPDGVERWELSSPSAADPRSTQGRRVGADPGDSPSHSSSLHSSEDAKEDRP